MDATMLSHCPLHVRMAWTSAYRKATKQMKMHGRQLDSLSFWRNKAIKERVSLLDGLFVFVMLFDRPFVLYDLGINLPVFLCHFLFLCQFLPS